MVANRERVIEAIRETAKREILPRFQRLGAADVSEKRPNDLVTTADIEAEKRLAAALEALLPGSAVVGEEASEADPGSLAALSGQGPVWLVDPIDGTHNYVNEIPCFATIVALCIGGETVEGWIHDPIAGRTAWAARGKGAWIGGKRVRAAAPAALSAMTGSVSYKLRKLFKADRAAGAGDVPEAVRYGCVGREYMDLTSGALHFAHYSKRLKPWDHAAGALIHLEAGGFSALTGTRSPYRPEPEFPGDSLLLAPDEACWEALNRLIGDD